mmetsp:Transcript_71550/g.113383  ORF Transcript_71550/g.113383 Transcript_71550/m.113383 type:complete len:119 (-) Transcript_71550:423-779(-)
MNGLLELAHRAELMFDGWSGVLSCGDFSLMERREQGVSVWVSLAVCREVLVGEHRGGSRRCFTTELLDKTFGSTSHRCSKLGASEFPDSLISNCNVFKVLIVCSVSTDDGESVPIAAR